MALSLASKVQAMALSLALRVEASDLRFWPRLHDCYDCEGDSVVMTTLVCRLPTFGNLAEHCLENTIMNIIHEAFRQEFNITARPRLVALPPRPSSNTV